MLKILLVLGCWVNIAFASKASVDLIQRLTSLKSMQADFTQKVLNANAKIQREYQGWLKLKKPGKLFWRVTGDEPSVLLIKDDTLLNYDELLEQASLVSGNINFSASPIGLLLAGSKQVTLEDSFTVKYSIQCSNADSCFEMIPFDSDQGFSRVFLGFKKNKLSFAKMYDNLGQTSYFYFTNVENNILIKDDVFEYELPEDVDLMSE